MAENTHGVKESLPFDREYVSTYLTEVLAEATGNADPEVQKLLAWLAAGVAPIGEPDPRMAFCPACFVEVTPEEAAPALAAVLREVAATFSLDYDAVCRAVGVMASGELSGLPTEIDRAAGVSGVDEKTKER